MISRNGLAGAFATVRHGRRHGRWPPVDEGGGRRFFFWGGVSV